MSAEKPDTLAGLTALLMARAGSYPEMPLLEEFRATASRLRTENQLRKSLDQAPSNAGPLNSDSLVHRSLSLMRDVSPGYLRHFVAYVDTLSWLERVTAGHAGRDLTKSTKALSGAGTRRRPG